MFYELSSDQLLPIIFIIASVIGFGCIKMISRLIRIVVCVALLVGGLCVVLDTTPAGIVSILLSFV